MDWSTVFLIGGLSFGALLVWVMINYLFLEKEWGDKLTMVLVVTVMLGNMFFLSWELILEGYWIIIPGLFITSFMLVAQIWLLQPTKKNNETEGNI